MHYYKGCIFKKSMVEYIFSRVCFKKDVNKMLTKFNLIDII